MKRILLLIIVVHLGFIISAQVTTGHITYKCDISSTDSVGPMEKSMIQHTKLEVYFNEACTRTVVDISSMMVMSSVVNYETGKALLIMEGMAGKKAIVSNFEELKEAGIFKNEKTKSIVKIDETKEIAGFTCKKAQVLNDDGFDLTIWYTDEIEFNTEAQQYLESDLPGIALEFEVQGNEFTMVFSVSKFEESFDKDATEIFNTDAPNGYEIISLKEFQSMVDE